MFGVDPKIANRTRVLGSSATVRGARNGVTRPQVMEGWLYEMRTSDGADVVGIMKWKDLLTFARKEVLVSSLHVLRTKKDLKTP